MTCSAIRCLIILSFVGLCQNTSATVTMMNGGHNAKPTPTTANLDFLNDLRSKYPHQPVYVPLGFVIRMSNEYISDKSSEIILLSPTTLIVFTGSCRRSRKWPTPLSHCSMIRSMASSIARHFFTLLSQSVLYPFMFHGK